MTVTDANEGVASLGDVLKAANEAASKLLESTGTDFLVSSSMVTLTQALRAHMKDKKVTQADIFEKVNKGKSANEAAFVKFLNALPDEIEHDELNAFSDERRVEIFKRVASDGKTMTEENFGKLFEGEMRCIKATALNDKPEVEGSSTVCMIESGAIVQIFGVQQELEGELVRSECKVGEQSGWVTIGQKKQKFFAPTSAFAKFMGELDKSLKDYSTKANEITGKTTAAFNKSKSAKEGALHEAKEDLQKLVEEAKGQQKAIADLQKKVLEAKAEHTKKENAERIAHVTKRKEKEALPFLEVPRKLAEVCEAAVKAAEEAAAPMASLAGDALKAYGDDAGLVMDELDKHGAVFKEKQQELKAALTEQKKAAAEVTPPSEGSKEAKVQLQKLDQQLQSQTTRMSKAQQLVKGKCNAIVGSYKEPVSAAIREHARSKDMSAEKIFESLAEDDKLGKDAFVDFVTNLEGLSFSKGLANMVFGNLQKDGSISKDTFTKTVCIFYKVLRKIAFTDSQDVNNTKTLRTGDEGELVELLEGPVLDEATGMSRIRARGAKDSVEGWITLNGSKGTTFLEKVNKA